MHPLLKRLLIRGPLMFLATAAIGLMFALLMRWMITSGNSAASIDGGPNVTVKTAVEGGIDPTGPLTFGVIGLVVYVILESISYLRERRAK